MKLIFKTTTIKMKSLRNPDGLRLMTEKCTNLCSNNCTKKDFIFMTSWTRKAGCLKLNKKILLWIKEQHHWKGNIYILIKRIKKIVNSQTFTAREVRLLKKLLKYHKKKRMSIEKVLVYFPGKSIDQIIEFKSKSSS